MFGGRHRSGIERCQEVTADPGSANAYVDTLLPAFTIHGCSSARGDHADRIDNSLILFDWEGAPYQAEQHARHRTASGPGRQRSPDNPPTGENWMTLYTGSSRCGCRKTWSLGQGAFLCSARPRWAWLRCAPLHHHPTTEPSLTQGRGGAPQFERTCIPFDYG